MSLAPTIIEIHPEGNVQDVGCTMIIGLGRLTSVSVGIAEGGVGDGSGEANSTTKVVGMGDGVGGNAGADVSARESEMPPMTSRREMVPMMNPLPICRRAFMISSPYQSCLWRSAATR